MKKQKRQILVTLTAVFAAFTLGFLLGRNDRRGDVVLSIPSAMQEPVPTSAPTLPAVTETQTEFPIDLNTATEEQLRLLPGIGEVLARRIVAYREENGSFQAVEELLNVEDIGEKRLEGILDYIKIGG